MSDLYPWGEDLPVLETRRLILRGLRETDLPALFAVFSEPEVMRYWSSTPHRDLAETAGVLTRAREGFAARSAFQWGVALGEDGTAIGTCTLFRVEPKHLRGEVGYVLGRPYWGKGMAGEALAAVIGFAFDALGLHRLDADVDPRNARSLKLLERMGFAREGYLRESYRIGTEVTDSVILGLLRPEWRGPR